VGGVCSMYPKAVCEASWVDEEGLPSVAVMEYALALEEVVLVGVWLRPVVVRLGGHCALGLALVCCDRKDAGSPTKPWLGPMRFSREEMPRPARGLGSTLSLLRRGFGSGSALAMEPKAGNKDEVSVEPGPEGKTASPYGVLEETYLGGKSCSNPKFARLE